MQTRKDDLLRFCMGQFTDSAVRGTPVDRTRPLLELLESGDVDRNAPGFEEVAAVLVRGLYELEMELYRARKLTEPPGIPEGLTNKDIVNYARRISPTFSRRYLGLDEQSIITYNFREMPF